MSLSVSNPKLTSHQVMNKHCINTEVSVRTVRWMPYKSNLNGCITAKNINQKTLNKMKTLSKRTSGNVNYAKVVDANDSKIEMNSNTKEYVQKNKLIQGTIKKIHNKNRRFFCSLGSTRKLIKINETLLKCPLLRYCKW